VRHGGGRWRRCQAFWKRNLLKVDRSMIYKLLKRGERPAFKAQRASGIEPKRPAEDSIFKSVLAATIGAVLKNHGG